MGRSEVVPVFPILYLDVTVNIHLTIVSCICPLRPLIRDVEYSVLPEVSWHSTLMYVQIQLLNHYGIYLFPDPDVRFEIDTRNCSKPHITNHIRRFTKGTTLDFETQFSR